MRTRITTKGQVTIPKRLRDRLGLRPGSILEFREEAGEVVARKAEDRDPVDELYGILRLDRTTDELIDEMRGERP